MVSQSESDADLHARLSVAEDEIARLRDFRHSYSSDKMAILMKIERFESQIAQLRADVSSGSSDRISLRAQLDAFTTEVRSKTAEYDRERGLAGKLVEKLIVPVIVALLIGGTVWLITFLLQQSQR